MSAEVEQQTQAPAPVRRRFAVPYVSWAIIIVCIGLWLLEALGRVELKQPLALFGPRVAAGDWWRVLGTVIVHADALHVLFNMSVVYTLGRELEHAIGSWRFALISLMTALGSSALALAFSYDVPTVGASGMIIGWAGAMLPISTPAGRKSLQLWLVQIVVISLLPFVSWQGHLGGFLFGLPCGYALKGGLARFAKAMPVLIALGVAANVAVVFLHASR
jgi:membrane associated rhomboid family serine protease